MEVRSKKLFKEAKFANIVINKHRLKMMNKELQCQLNLEDCEMNSYSCERQTSMVEDMNVGKTLRNCLNVPTLLSLLEENKGECNNSENRLIQCEFCGKQYKNHKRLKDHLRFCHPKVYHKCVICCQQFPKKWILNTHTRKHTGEFPYSCSYCEEKFISNSKLQTHSNFYHNKKELSCTICNASGFYTKQDLGNHIRTKHTKERAFQCNICNKSFMSSSVYYQHRFIHSNIKKYTCIICSKSFRRWLTLHNHLKIHKNELPFSCDVCKQAFRQRGDMKKHKVIQHSNLATSF